MAAVTTPPRPTGDFRAVEKRLEIFRTAGKAHQENLEELLSYCQSLLEDIQLLEAERNSDKQILSIVPTSSEVQQPQQTQHSKSAYVAVLVDGNDYLFKEGFIKAQYTGGVAAGEQLFDSVAQQLPEGWKGGDVIACVYADLDRIANLKSITENAKSQKSEIMDFFSGFTGSFSSFDFINAGENHGSTVAKLSRKFRLCINDSNCKHVFFAACYDKEYLTMLEECGQDLARVSLVRTKDLDPEFVLLPSKIIELPEVFGPAQTPTASAGTGADETPTWTADSGWNSEVAPGRNTNATENDPASDWNIDPVENTNADNIWDAEPVQTPEANTIWVPAPAPAPAPARKSARTPYRLHMGNRRRASSSSSSSSRTSSPVTAPGTNSMSSGTSKPNQWATPQANNNQHAVRGTCRRPWTAQRIAQLRSIAIPKDEPAVLSSLDTEEKDFISVNREGQRVDRPLPAPTSDALLAFRSVRTKPCQHLAISGFCQFGDHCEYDHTLLDEDMIHAMRWTLRHNPCEIGSGCRWVQCKRGHNCQRPGCKAAGYRECQLPPELHNIDGRFGKWVRPIGLHSETAWREQISHARHEASQSGCENDWNDRATGSMASVREAPRAKTSYANQQTSWDEPSKSQQSSWDEPSSREQQPSWDKKPSSNQKSIREKQSSWSSTSVPRTTSKVEESRNREAASESKARKSDWHYEHSGGPPADRTPSWDQSYSWEQQPRPWEQQPVPAEADASAVDRESKLSTSHASDAEAASAEEPPAQDLISFSDASEDESERLSRIARIKKSSKATVASPVKQSVASKSAQSSSTSGKSSSSRTTLKAVKSPTKKPGIPEGVWSPGEWR